MYTIGQLVKQFGLSRSTLLYYDKIGLLKPSGRSDSNYRLYNEDDLKRMQQICIYKEAGLTLDTVADILEGQNNQTTALLEKRLAQLNQDISDLRRQQQVIVGLLGKTLMEKSTRVMNKQQWVAILKASGMDEDAMRQWHIEFERAMPEAHQDFLESLGIDEIQIKHIRNWYRLEN